MNPHQYMILGAAIALAGVLLGWAVADLSFRAGSRRG